MHNALSNVINLASQFRCPLVLEKYPKARLPFYVTIFRLAVAYCHVNVFLPLSDTPSRPCQNKYPADERVAAVSPSKGWDEVAAAN